MINIINQTKNNEGDSISKIFVCEDISKLNDNNYNEYKYIGNGPRSEGYVKEIIFGDEGDIMPSIIGASSTQFFCDYHYTRTIIGELCDVKLGGSSFGNTYNGILYFNTWSTYNFSDMQVGTRLCFIPQQNKN